MSNVRPQLLPLCPLTLLFVARYRTFVHHDVPFGVTIPFDYTYLSNSLLNVLLFSLTRRYQLPHATQLPSMAIISEPSPGVPVPVAGSSCSKGPYEGTRALAHEWCDIPQVESPTPTVFPRVIGPYERQHSVESFGEKAGREE